MDALYRDYPTSKTDYDSDIKFHSDGVFLPLKVNGLEAEFRIKPDLELSMLSVQVYESFDAKKRPLLRKSSDAVFSMSGQDVTVLGIVEISISFRFGKSVFKHKLFVADLKTDRLLGRYLMQLHEFPPGTHRNFPISPRRPCSGSRTEV